MGNPITQHLSEIRNSCSRYQVNTLYAFGSVITDEFNDKSDVDLVVDFNETDPLVYGELYFGLKFELEQLLHRDIDLLEAKAIRNQRFRQAITPKMQLVYAGANSGLA
jgi:predicted nucleotidyltransferase